ncbi:MAG: hypothetical protein WD552_02115 [Candidatus Paceibacterota bacterium]
MMIENFKQHIYRDPEKKKEGDPEYTQEQLEQAEKVATEKLEKILDPEFVDYSVRYMNIGEYNDILKSGEISREFIDSKFMGRYMSGKHNVRNLLKRSKDIMSLTNWSNISGKSVSEVNLLIDAVKDEGFLRESLSVDPDVDVDKKSLIRDYLIRLIKKSGSPLQTYSNFSENDSSSKELLSKLSFLTPEEKKELGIRFDNYYENGLGGEWSFRSEISDELDLTEDQDKLLEKYLIRREEELDIGKENTEIIYDFMNDPDFLEQKDGLRKIIIAITNSHRLLNDSERRQYHIAVIVDNSKFKFRSSEWGLSEWRRMSGGATDEKDVAEGILGAISVYQLKYMYKEMINLDKGAGDFAHPIFDSNGVVRFPSEKAGMNVTDAE